MPLRTKTMLTDGDDSITGVLLLSSSGAWIAKMINSMNRQVLLIEITGSMILFALSFIFAWTSSTPWKNLVTTLNQDVYKRQDDCKIKKMSPVNA